MLDLSRHLHVLVSILMLQHSTLDHTLQVLLLCWPSTEWLVIHSLANISTRLLCECFGLPQSCGWIPCLHCQGKTTIGLCFLIVSWSFERFSTFTSRVKYPAPLLFNSKKFLFSVFLFFENLLESAWNTPYYKCSLRGNFYNSLKT